MASKIFDTYLLRLKELEVMVYVKDVKRVSFRMSRLQSDLISMSLPHNYPKDLARGIISDNFELLQKMVERNRTLRANKPEPSQTDIDRFRQRLSDLVPQIEMAMNLHASRYTIRFMRSRWGSCTPANGHISLNAALAALPPEFTEYVLVHELAHMVHPNHSPAFWLMVERFCPDYRRCRMKMKSIPL